MEYQGRNVPNKLRKHRKAFGYTQAQVAKKIGLSDVSRLSKWEQGKSTPGLIYLIKLSIVYSAFTNDIYEDLFRLLKEELSDFKPFSCLEDVSKDDECSEQRK